MRWTLLLICLLSSAGGGKPESPSTAATTRPVARKLEPIRDKDAVVHKITGTPATIRTPPQWREVEGRHKVVLQLVAGDHSGANLNVVIVPPPASGDSAAQAAQLIKASASRVDNFGHSSWDLVEVAGIQAPRIVFEGDLGGKRLRWQQTMISAKAHTYVITYACGIESYAEHEAEVDGIVGSFKAGE